MLVERRIELTSVPCSRSSRIGKYETDVIIHDLLSSERYKTTDST